MIFLGILSTSDISTYTDIFKFIGDMFEKTYIHPIIFFEIVFVSVIAFIVRYMMLYKMAKSKGFKNNKRKKEVQVYYLSRIAIEFILSFLVSYVFVILTIPNPESHVVNAIIAPAVGMLVAITIDNKYIIQYENTSKFGALSNKSEKEGTDNEKATNITVNVNNNDKDINNENVEELKQLDHLEKDLVESDNFNEKIVDSINYLIDVQNKQNVVLNKNQTQICNIESNVDTLRESALIDKKLEIKSMIYRVLNNGYATPEENDQITLKYLAYRKLGGNHEIQSLYEDHYLKLPVHDIGVTPETTNDEENETKEPTRKYQYGEFD